MWPFRLPAVDEPTLVNLIFPITLIASELLLVYWAPKKHRFAARLTIGAQPVFIFAACCNPFPYFVNSIIYYLGVFLLSVTMLWLSFDISAASAASAGITAYAMQHIAYSFSQICMLPLNRYFPDMWPRTNMGRVFLILAYIPMYFTIVRGFKRQKRFVMPNRDLAFISSTVLVTVIVLNLFETYYLDRSDNVILLFNIYRMICCAVTLILQSGVIRISRLTEEQELLRHLHEADKRQETAVSDNMEMLSMKIHDMKHQLLRLNRENRESSEYAEEIKRVVSDFETIVQTGNRSLDIILTEKEFVCQKNSIQLNYSVDGAKMEFMDPVDIYSLVGNALDNAIQSITEHEVADEHRIIYLTIGVQNSFVKIVEENYCAENLTFKNGLPLTTHKTKNELHGYGVKSIRYIVERYNGLMDITLEDSVFTLSAFIPIPTNNKTAVS